MPDLKYAILADHVRIENGLGFIIGAGIQWAVHPDVPAGQNVGLMLSVAYTRAECDRPHSIEVLFQDEDGEKLLEATATSTPTWDSNLPAGWSKTIPFGLNLGIPLPRHGLYSFEILIDDRSVDSMPFRVIAELPQTSENPDGA